MRLTMKTICRTAMTLLISGSTMSVALAPATAAGVRGGFHGGGGFHDGGGFRGGGYGGFRGGYGGFRGYGYRGYGGFGYRGYGCCYGGYYGGFGVGDALLGAALIGTTAAVIASDQPYYGDYPAPAYPVYAPPAGIAPPLGYGYPQPAPLVGQPQSQAYQSTDPVEQCTRAAVSEAASRGDSGRVTRIDHVDGYANGARVIGTLEVHRASRDGAVENARFTCTADYGQVTNFRFG